MSKLGGKREGAGRKAGSPNKATSVIRELACKHGETAIQALVTLLEAVDTPAAAKVSAAKELIERGYGRTGNFVNLELEKPLSELTPAAAMATIIDMVTTSKVSTEEGQRLVNLIEARMKSVEIEDIEKRLIELEGTKS